MAHLPSSSTAGKTITCKAAVAWGPKRPLLIEDIQVAPPQPGEARIRITHSSLCHTDIFYCYELEEGIFPRILGHEGAGIVESVGEGVTDVQEGDHVIPLYVAQCMECRNCKSGKTNLCMRFRPEGTKTVMEYDKKTRFSKDGKPIYHFLSISSFTQYTVVEQAYIAKVNPNAPLHKICPLGCGIPTGLGAVWNTAKVEPGSTVIIIGLGSVGLAVAEGARIAGASRIIGVDINTHKFEKAKEFAVTEFVNPKDHDRPIQEVLQEMTSGGADYCFECVGKVDLMKAAFDSCHEGWGKAILIGFGGIGEKICFGALDFLYGRQISGSIFGDFKGRNDISKLVEKYLSKELNLDGFISHELPFSEINQAFQLLQEGKSLKSVLHF